MKIVKRSEKRFNCTCESCESVIQLKKTEALPDVCPVCGAEAWTSPDAMKEVAISSFELKLEELLRKAEIRRSLRRKKAKKPD